MTEPSERSSRSERSRAEWIEALRLSVRTGGWTAEYARQMLALLDELEAPRSELRNIPKDDVPLKCEVIDGSIQIVIGAKVLAHATNICPGLYDAEKDRWRYKVTDHAAFAKDVASTLNHESEDGSTRLTKMMDAAIEHAIDYGAEGVEENTDEHSERSEP